MPIIVYVVDTVWNVIFYDGYLPAEGPFNESSRLVLNTSNTFDSIPSNVWAEGTFLFELVNGTARVWRNEFFGFAIKLVRNQSQVLRSQKMITQCLTSPGIAASIKGMNLQYLNLLKVDNHQW